MHDNQDVKAGDVLFEIDRARFQLAYDQAEASVRSQQVAREQALRDAKRNRSLGQLVAAEALEQSQTKLQPNVLVANMDFPATNFADFIKLVRANPGKYTHASSGNGSSGHLAMEMLKQAAKLDLVHVPYKGGAAAITDMIGGRVSVMPRPGNASSAPPPGPPSPPRIRA
ncbi:tripartite tricarboxylate transporter substrate-binding protein [Lactiplantibacillus plantarum]|uniref:tripartite tricarboxylate transporter substrate-binding protein n=1 Tax=Lactiplantibacillus plantarum TaxID=1590 RepID=UPI00404586D4